MRQLLIGTLSLIGLLSPLQVVNAAVQEIGSCYTMVKVDDVTPPPLKRELFVLIDQTVNFDQAIQGLVNQKIQKFLRPSDRIVMVSFSAYAKGRYSQFVFDGRIDANLTEQVRYRVPKIILGRLDACIQQQEQAVRGLIVENLRTVFQDSSSKLPRTELVGNLAMLSQQLKTSTKTSERFLLIVSDMLEHSGITSFYTRGKIRHIDPETELKKIQNAGMISAFDDTSVYIIGAGYTGKKAYRSAVVMKTIEGFWRQYFEISGARVREFGTPILFSEIGS
jgi:hypothetical protein